MKERRWSSTHSNLATRSVSSRLHAPAALRLGKKHPVLIVQEARWTSESVWKLWRREQSLPPPGIETRFSGCQACSLVTKPMSHADPKRTHDNTRIQEYDSEQFTHTHTSCDNTRGSLISCLSVSQTHACNLRPLITDVSLPPFAAIFNKTEKYHTKPYCLQQTVFYG
jgi:hypothetical protein